MAAARAAGLYVLGVPSVPGIVLEADLVVESLEDPLVPITIGSGSGGGDATGASSRGLGACANWAEVPF